VANFTSLADPTAVGSGHTALKTLLHEAGHAAHFANVVQPSPLFSQERAPTSVAYAETQSMFLDSLLEDAAWNAKYAKHSKTSQVIPFDILKENIEATHPFAVFPLRAMLAVSYFEKALYELPEEEITVEKIEKLADQIEITIQGGLSPRPLLSVPHLVSDEASCYYHGYTMAEMAVYQTRDYFLEKYGYIVDNPEVGRTLTTAYWSAGNSKPFLDLVHELTGKPLTGDAWVKKLNEPLEDKIVKEKANYNRAIEEGSVHHEQPLEKLLDMTVRFVHGDELVADSSKSGIIGACEEFESYIYACVAEATS
jgi:oligoendopeptidase F